MLSFTSLVKDEIVEKTFQECCQKALLAAFLKFNSVIDNNNLNVIKTQSFHKKTIELIYNLLKNHYSNIKLNLLIDNYRNSNHYTIVISSCTNEIINEFKLLESSLLFLKNNKLKNHCLRAYTAGIFLVSGSINSPVTPNYHLEFQFNNLEDALKIQSFLTHNFNLNFKIINRRKKSVLYLKKSNDICDFLKVLDCPQAVFTFEDKRITRELLNTINRFNNIDISNQQKSINAANEQIKIITTLKVQGKFQELSDKCQLLANLRLKHQDVSLVELTDIYFEKTGDFISKSGVNHLIRELKKKYKEL